MTSFRTLGKQEIKMSDDSGKWLPYNLDGSIHECKGKDQPRPQQQPQKKQLTLEDLDTRLKKIEHTLYGDN